MTEKHPALDLLKPAEESESPRFQIEVRSSASTRERDLEELGNCLRASPPWIPAKFFYDARGSELFEAITELPEYYQTRTEELLLLGVADQVAARSEATELLELGSGAARKTRTLLDAMSRSGLLQRYVPIDVDPVVTRRVAAELLAEYPALEIHAIITDILAPLVALPQGHHRLVIFLGGTIGNLNDDACERFLDGIGEVINTGDHFLLGVDRIKSKARLEAAYNDSAGITADFNLNILEVVNAFAHGDFDQNGFEHVSIYNEAKHRIEMWLRARSPQRVALADLDLELSFETGDSILTEISTKYDKGLIQAKLDHAGFELEDWHTDEESLFGLALARRR